MSRQIIVASGDIPDHRDNTSGFKEDRVFLDDEPYGQQQRDSEEIDNNKNVNVPAIRGKKIVITIASAKRVVEKLLTVLTKVDLVEDKQDMSVIKI